MAQKIVREHSQFLVVDKPAGWLVHPTRPDGTFTLIDWLREQFPGEFLSLVSRLDRETSGLLLAARGKPSASILGKMQQRREIQKTYLAIVHGRPPESGVIDEPLDRIGKHRPSRIYIRQGVIPGSYAAVTHFRTLATRTNSIHGEISLVEAIPKTGRLHQIRAHFEHLGFPVLNDKIYGKNDEYFINYIVKDLIKSKVYPRHCLHSAKVAFKFKTPDCIHEEEVSQEIPLPEDLRQIWDDQALIPAPRPDSRAGEIRNVP